MLTDIEINNAKDNVHSVEQYTESNDAIRIKTTALTQKTKKHISKKSIFLKIRVY